MEVMMRAARVLAIGSLADIVVEDIPIPVPEEDQLLVKVDLAALNPIDYKVALPGHRGGREFPLTLGFDAVGTVSVVGSAVSSVAVGDRVCLMTDIMAPGTAAEYVLARERNVAAVPAGIGDAQAAGLPLAGLTALQALDLAGLQAGQSVLIHAGAGGVGHLAIQIAKHRGATVYATSSAPHLELLAELGADHPVDYHATPPGKFACRVDLVLDTQGGAVAEATVAAMRPGSVHVSIVGFSPAGAGRDDVRMETMLVEPRAAELATLLGMMTDGSLRVVVDEVTDLGAFVTAIRALHDGHTTGKRLIAIR
jgi:NADPH:quinone reductase-like Zn-dependent oxidoreductase